MDHKPWFGLLIKSIISCVILNTAKPFSVNIPEDANEEELKLSIAATLFDRGLLSSGRAAEFAGVSKKVFLLSASKHGVSVFGEDVNDLNG